MLLNNGVRACFEPVSTSKQALVLVALEVHGGTHPAVFEIIVIPSLTQETKFWYSDVNIKTNHLSLMRLKTAALLVITLLSTNLFMSSSLAYAYTTNDTLCQWLEKKPWHEGHKAERAKRGLDCKTGEVVAKADTVDVKAETKVAALLDSNQYPHRRLKPGDIKNVKDVLDIPHTKTLAFGGEYSKEWNRTRSLHYTKVDNFNLSQGPVPLTIEKMVGAVKPGTETYHGIVKVFLERGGYIIGEFIDGQRHGWHKFKFRAGKPEVMVEYFQGNETGVWSAIGFSGWGDPTAGYLGILSDDRQRLYGYLFTPGRLVIMINGEIVQAKDSGWSTRLVGSVTAELDRQLDLIHKWDKLDAAELGGWF